MTKKLILLFCLLNITLLTIYAKEDLSYLDGMPSAEAAAAAVESKLINGDAVILYAKKASCLNVLYDLVVIMGKGRYLNSSETELMNSYYKMADDLRKKYENLITDRKQKELFKKLYYQYKSDDRMQNFVLSSLITPKTKKAILKQIDWINAEETEGPARENKKNMLITFLLAGTGIILLVFAFILKYNLQKYEFYNRTDGGVVKFTSHSKSVLHSSKNGIANLMYGVGTILVCVAIFYYFATKH